METIKSESTEKAPMEQRLVIDGDNCYLKLPISDHVVSNHLVMTKEIFIECYNRWIVGESDDSTMSLAKIENKSGEET